LSRHWRIILLGILVSGAAVFMIASQINFELLAGAFRTAFTPAGLGWILLAAASAVMGLVMRAVRWRVLLNGGLPLNRSFHVLNIAYLVNGLLPLRIGEVARVWLASRGAQSVPMLQSAGTVVVERLLDLLAVVVQIALALIIAGDRVPQALRDTGVFMGVVSVTGFLFLVFLAGQRALAQKLLGFFSHRIVFLGRLKLDRWLDHLLDGLQPITRPASLGKALLWTTIAWIFSFFSGYLVMPAFFGEADVVTTLLFISAASFAVALPAVPGNIGTYEASILLALTAMGYTTTPEATATATAFAVTVHLLNLGINALLGVVGFVAEGVTLEQISRGVQGVQTQPQAAGDLVTGAEE
jgi:glycosyltransferase 2 family protein